MSVSQSAPQKNSTPIPSRYFDIVVVVFVAFLLLSNITATKLIAANLGPLHLIFDGGAILFPLTYILGDILAEVYGFKAARKAIFLGFAVSILASVIFLLVQISPPAPGYTHQAAFSAVLGFVPRIVGASLCAYLVGQLLNALVLTKIKQRYGSNRLWVRLVSSTIIGEAADTFIFCTIAFYGVITGTQFLNYLLTGYFYKVAVEIIFLPLTYPVIAWFKHQVLAPDGPHGKSNSHAD